MKIVGFGQQMSLTPGFPVQNVINVVLRNGKSAVLPVPSETIEALIPLAQEDMGRGEPEEGSVFSYPAPPSPNISTAAPILGEPVDLPEEDGTSMLDPGEMVGLPPPEDSFLNTDRPRPSGMPRPRFMMEDEDEGAPQL